MRTLILLSCLAMAACEPARNNPAQQAEDFKVCKDAGMAAYLNGSKEIRCAPPAQRPTNGADKAGVKP